METRRHTNWHIKTYKVTDTHAVLTPRHLATPLHRCPSLPSVCLQPHFPYPPAWDAAGASPTSPAPFRPRMPVCLSTPAAHAPPTEQNSHRAPLPPPPPSLCASASSQLLTALRLSISPSRLCVSRSGQASSGSLLISRYLLISRSLSPVSSSLTGLYFSHGLSIPFHLSLSLSAWFGLRT